MADNVTLPGTGDIVHADEFTHSTYGAGKSQVVKLLDATPGSSLPLNVYEDLGHTTGDPGIAAMAVRKAAPANLSGTDGDYEPLQMNAGALWVSPLGFPVTVQTDVTLPTSSIYGIADAISDSTSAPTSGGFTLTNAARKSGGSGIITDMTVSLSSDPATRLSGEIFLFNQSVTAINDNAAFVVSDTEIKTCVGIIPFSCFDAGNNQFAHMTGLNFLFTCSGSANLRFLIRARNTYTPTTSEVLTVTAKILQID